MTDKVDSWFATLTDAQRPLLVELRQIVLSCNENFVEELKWGEPCYSLNGLVCYLQ